MSRKVTVVKFDPSHNWVDLPQFAAKINVKPRHLRDLIANGTLKPSTHWIDVRSRGAAKARYRLNLQTCLAYFATPAEVRHE